MVNNFDAEEKTLLNASMVLKKQEISLQSSPSGAMAGKVSFDDLLLAVGKSRNKDAFVRIFEHFAPRVKSFLMRGGMADETADELAQETMLTVWNKADSYNPAQAAASTWIFTIARNKKIDYLRKIMRVAPDPNDPFFQNDDEQPDDSLAHAQESQILADAIKKLPEDQAFLIRKSFYEDKTHQAISEETNIPLGTVKSRIRLALEKLRHTMDSNGVRI